MKVPPSSAWGVLWALAPIGEKVDGSQDGKQTGFFIIDGGNRALTWTIPTDEFAGGRGFRLEMFGVTLDSMPATGPVLCFALRPKGGVVFQPWLLRAYKPGSPLVAEIYCAPDLPRPRKSIEIEMDTWDNKLYDRWQASAGKAMKFLHDFRRHIAGGSPQGPRKGEIWDRRRCLGWWASWTELDGPPTQKKLAVDMGLSKNNPEEAAERWRSTGLHWPPTEEELEDDPNEQDE
jgi:hypothetical protein